MQNIKPSSNKLPALATLQADFANKITQLSAKLSKKDQVTVDAYLCQKGSFEAFFPAEMSAELIRTLIKNQFLSARVYILLQQSKKYFQVADSQEIKQNDIDLNEEQRGDLDRLNWMDQIVNEEIQVRPEKNITTVSTNDKSMRHLFELLQHHKIDLSYDCYFWKQKYPKPEFRNLHEKIEKKLDENSLSLVDSIQSSEIKQVCLFLRQIGLISSPQFLYNPLLMKLHRLTKRQNQQLLVLDQSNLQLSFQYKFPNYLFYAGVGMIRHKTMTIEQLHAKRGNYVWLQSIHDYIQWMFPNHYGSKFNSDSYMLGYTEAEMFQSDYSVGCKMLESITIFLDFLGISMSKVDGRLCLASRERLIQAICINTHNHLRIMRILACLSVLGFRKIALNLIQCLRFATTVDVKLSKQFNVFQNQWQIYDDEHIEKAKSMCFIVTKDFPEDNLAVLKYFENQLVRQEDGFQDKGGALFLRNRLVSKNQTSQKERLIPQEKFEFMQAPPQKIKE